MKLYKLITHQKTFSGRYQIRSDSRINCYQSLHLRGCFFLISLAEDLILNPKDHPEAKIGDVVEIYLPDGDGVRLLLQITSFQEDKKGTKGTLFCFINSYFNYKRFFRLSLNILRFLRIIFKCRCNQHRRQHRERIQSTTLFGGDNANN